MIQRGVPKTRTKDKSIYALLFQVKLGRITQTRNYNWGSMSSFFAPTQTSTDRTSNSAVTNIQGKNYNLLTKNLSPIAEADRKITKEHMTR